MLLSLVGPRLPSCRWVRVIGLPAVIRPSFKPPNRTPQPGRPISPFRITVSCSSIGLRALHQEQRPSNTSRVRYENIYTVPNLLTASRLVAAPVIGYFIINDQYALATLLFAYAGVTDWLDGYIARRWRLHTVVGTVIDPMADKILMTVLTVSLAFKGILPAWLAGLILLRDVGLAISAIYYRWISLPSPKTFTRYWDFSLPSAEVRPTTISKYNTALQLALMGLTTVSPLLNLDISTPLSILHYVVATTTVWSGASYIYNKDAVHILGQEGDRDK